MTLTDYQKALEKMRSAPLTLTDYDFAALEEFNPADERKGRDALRRAQLALVETKTAPPLDETAVLVNTLELVLTKALQPVVARLSAAEKVVADLGDISKRLDALERASLERQWARDVAALLQD